MPGDEGADWREGAGECKLRWRGRLRFLPGFPYFGKQYRSDLKDYSSSCRCLVSDRTIILEPVNVLFDLYVKTD